jgi:hypothetical protein
MTETPGTYNAGEPKPNYPPELQPVLAKIRHLSGLGIAEWFEVICHQPGPGWLSFEGTTFRDGEQVLAWKLISELESQLQPSQEVSTIAGTEELIALKAEFPGQFTDPEPEEEEINWRGYCDIYLYQIRDNPVLHQMAVEFLSRLADIHNMSQQAINQSVAQAVIIPALKESPNPDMPHFPETHARESKADCPSGMCEL